MSANRDLEEEIFDAARELAADERAAYLAEKCGHDADLRQRIEGMLEADAAAGEFFKTAVAPSSTILGADTELSASIEKVGDRIGRYKLLQQIGEGGMGLVYMAEQDQPVRRSVALKIIKLGMDTRQVVARFEAERQALAMMNHPHIAKVLDAGATDSGRPYFVMELVRGIPITEYCDKNCLPTRQRLDLFILVCQAVQHAHQKGVIHRDLKPSNILVTLNDGVPWPMIIDFGIAKATNQRLTEKTLFTHFAQMIGTPAYMSPEQAEMSKLDVDTRSDIYALGVLLYELLTGTTPFSSKELLSLGYREMQRTIAEREPLRLSTRLSTMANEERTVVAKNRSVDANALGKLFRGDLDWIAMKCLEKDRTRRYETANALAADIRRHLDCEPVVARPPSKLYEFQKTVRRHKFGFAAATALVLVLILGLAISIWQAVRATKAEKLADDRLAEAVRARQDAEVISAFMSEVIRSPDPARDGRSIQVVELLDRAAKKLETELDGQPHRLNPLQARLGYTYIALGLYREAIPLFEKSRDFTLVTFGRENKYTLESLRQLATAYHGAGRLEEALKLREEVLAIQRKVNGPEHPDTLYSMYNLSVSYRDAGREDDAFKLGEEALALHLKVLGSEHRGTLGVMGHMAEQYFRTSGRKDEGLKLGEEALALYRKVSGPEATETLGQAHNVANYYHEVGRKDEALKMREEILRLRRKVNGPEYPDTLKAMISLAISYHYGGRREEALKLREEGLALYRKVLSPEHPETLWAMQHLASSYFEANRREEALKLREEVLALWRKVLGPEHPNTLRAMDSLADSYRAAKRMDEAIKLGEERLALKRKVRPEDSETLWDMIQLAISYRKASRTNEAIKLGQSSLELFRRVSGPTHRDTLNAMTELAISYRVADRIAEAIPLEEESLRLKRQHLRPGDSFTMESIENLAKCYEKASRQSEAAALRLEAAHARLKKLRGRVQPNDPQLDQPLAKLTQLLIDGQNYAEAEVVARESLALREKLMPGKWVLFNTRSVLGGILAERKNYAEAEPLLLSGYEGLKQQLDTLPAAGKLCLSNSLRRLAHLCEATGQPEKAAEWNKELTEFDQALAEKHGATPKAPQSQP